MLPLCVKLVGMRIDRVGISEVPVAVLTCNFVQPDNSIEVREIRWPPNEINYLERRIDEYNAGCAAYHHLLSHQP